MGLFSKKKKVSPEEEAALAANRERLSTFQVTKAWGVKKYAPAMQFIYDKEGRCFVVVEGPEDTFKERNPYVIDFDQVTDVALEVEEKWSEGGGQYDIPGHGNLLQERYAEVFWRYDFFLNIATTHPYAGNIRYQMNFKTTILQVPGRKFMFRRGLELNGTFRGEAIAAEVQRLEAFLDDEKKAIRRGDILEIVTLKRDRTILEGVKKQFDEERYAQKIETVIGHIKRADRIDKLLLGRS